MQGNLQQHVAQSAITSTHNAVCCSVLQRVAACCSGQQCVAACCSVLQRVAASCFARQVEPPFFLSVLGDE